MKRVIEAVRKKQLGTRAAAQQYNVPRSTLKDKVNAAGSVDADTLANSKLGRKPVLTCEVEKALVKYCLQMEQLFFGLRAKDVMRMAFTLAENNNFPHAFNKTKQMAGWKWFRGLMRRHSEISLRSPQATSLARVKGFNKESVTKFFDIYEPLLNKIKFQLHRIYNVDETGLTVVQHKTRKVVGLKGKKTNWSHFISRKRFTHHCGDMYECNWALRPVFTDVSLSEHVTGVIGWSSKWFNCCLSQIRMDSD